jgi:hypothetical protein
MPAFPVHLRWLGVAGIELRASNNECPTPRC